MKLLSRVQVFVTPWTVARQAVQSMEFSRQECWSGLLFPPPGDIPDPGIEPASPVLQADSLPLSHQGSPSPGSLSQTFLLPILSIHHVFFVLGFLVALSTLMDS